MINNSHLKWNINSITLPTFTIMQRTGHTNTYKWERFQNLEWSPIHSKRGFGPKLTLCCSRIWKIIITNVWKMIREQVSTTYLHFRSDTNWLPVGHQLTSGRIPSLQIMTWTSKIKAIFFNVFLKLQCFAEHLFYLRRSWMGLLWCRTLADARSAISLAQYALWSGDSSPNYPVQNNIKQ